jgi:hypothetical protein
MTTLRPFTCFALDRATPALWRATFNHPPINLVDAGMLRDLVDLFAHVERNEGPARDRREVRLATGVTTKQK